jgi:polyhydroxyalkanoate synthesis regulator phasin
VTEETQNLILRLLRDIRATQDKHSVDLTTLKRHMVEVQESVPLAVGFSVSSKAHYETTAERIDRLPETVAALTQRIEALEKQP